MGRTLSNGVYLPDEGERNCYAGLKVNWEILNQKVADISALQLAIAGALHREIVASLPTTDIDPNTIYMILNGTSATENVYDEYMYVNNAWELIGTSATDLTNYYTKAEVDGKLLLKANASDLTSHTGDTTIHVTANDKTKWTNSANTHVLRLALSALTPSTSDNSFSNLDDSTALKVGDKVMDTAGVLFEVTAIDTQNSTFTIGTALVDLAQDSDVVHLSGNETISGLKTITDTNLEFKSTSAEYGVSAGDSSVIFKDKNNLQTFKIYSRVFSSGLDNNLVSFFLTQKVDNTYYISNGVQLFASTGNKNAILRPILANNNADGLSVSLGDSNRRWQSVYATNYYYGSNNVEFSTKFVTTDTAQTISGNKTFSSINGVEPSSLSLPSDRSARIDISSYITNLSNGDNNQYIVPANGYIWLHFTSINSAFCYSQTSGGLTNYAQTFVRYSGDGQLYAFFPVRKDDYFIVQIYTSSTAVVQNAYFIPCQGNV